MNYKQNWMINKGNNHRTKKLTMKKFLKNYKYKTIQYKEIEENIIFILLIMRKLKKYF
jgi:hypothetical protein